MKKRQRYLAYWMLVSSFLLLVSTIIPHHHHEDGTFCFSLSVTEEKQHEEEGHHEAHQCTCTGHNQAIYTSLQNHFTGDNILLYLIPLETLYAYTAPDYLIADLFLSRKHAVDEEPVYQGWTAKAAGLRAPPVEVL